MHLAFAFVGFFVVATLIVKFIDAVLGVSAALASLPRWIVVFHETLYMFFGMALYAFIQSLP